MIVLKKLLVFYFFCFIFSNAQISKENFIIGADISSLINLQKSDVAYYVNGEKTSLLKALKDNSFNTIRLRLWHSPEDESNNLSNTLALSKTIKSYGFKLILDIHYSDSWADPANQKIPKSWENISFSDLQDSVYNYTYKVISLLKQQNTLPEYVQIGNEITCGFLWDHGLVCGKSDNPQQWEKFTTLMKKAISAVKDASESNESVKIIIHTDKGANFDVCNWFYQNLENYSVDYDIIGLSYYPWWSGALSDFENNLDNLSNTFQKEILLLETSYPWTLSYNDATHNPVGEETQLLGDYDASADGQYNYLKKIIEITNSSNNTVQGITLWEPGWISTDSFGSPWENLTLFDFNGNALKSLSVFNSHTGIKNINNYKTNLNQNFPNPFNPYTCVEFNIEKKTFVKIDLFNIEGKHLFNFLTGEFELGNYIKSINLSNYPSGIYICRLTTDYFVKSIKMILIK